MNWLLLILMTVASAAESTPASLYRGQIVERLRSMSRSPALPKSAIPGPEFRPEILSGEVKHRTLEAIERANLRAASAAVQPWSSTYWPIAQGLLAWRYSDPNFPNPKELDWTLVDAYFANPANSCTIDQLSPAEKYDLLVGSQNQVLTQSMLGVGRGFQMSQGKVDYWMGICHGWAAAAIMALRPQKTVEVLAADGVTKLKFYPADIKALASLLWANGNFETRFVGKRCDVEGQCQPANPASWHLSTVQRIGVERKSFVLNVMHTTEIWNQPVYKYQYSYFNPRTQQPAKRFVDAEVKLKDFPTDRFKGTRSPLARSVVGIAMDVTYGDETDPTDASRDFAFKDLLTTVTYRYDLELSDSREIVGGEWYSDDYPGFFWAPAAGTRALSFADPWIPLNETWDGSTPVPASWLNAAEASARSLQPLAKIVDTLLLLSR